MAISVEARTEIITLIVGMFGASPGAAILDDLSSAREGGMTLKGIAASLAGHSEFRAMYPTHTTNEEFATALVENLVGSEVPNADKAAAAIEIAAMLNAGATRSDVIVDVIATLDSVPEDHPVWGDAAARLNNQVEVAIYHSVTAQQNGADLEELQNVIGNVTSDDATVDEAIDDINDEEPNDPVDLTTGADTLNGFAGDDVYNALSVDEDGNIANTLTAFDKIDGGAGNDTLNIYTTALLNDEMPATASVKNVEVVNIFNTIPGSPGDLGDASKFVGVKQLWQVGGAIAVTNLLSTTTAGFRMIDDGSTLEVEAATGAASANVALDEVGETNSLDVDVAAGTALNTLNITGAVIDSDLNDTVDAINTMFTVGAAQATATVNSAVAIDLDVVGAGVKTVDASGSTGAIAHSGATTTTTIKSGSGDDDLTIETATTATVAALVESGAGDDTVTVDATGAGAATVTTADGDDTVTLAGVNTGTTTVNTGAGADSVNVTANAGKLVINLGDGNDSFASTVAIDAADSVDAGAGTDTLLLSLVGVANVGAFKNFDVYDVVGMGANLDLDILNANNTVAEIVGSGALVAPATLQNVAAGVNFRATGDMGMAPLTLTQKTAGALTVTLDADEKAPADAGDDTAQMFVAATNATSVTAVFDTAFLAAAGAVGGESLLGDNLSGIALTTTAATSVNVVSGGANSSNITQITDAGNKLATITVTGAQALTLATVTTTALTAINASAHTGGLTVALSSLKDGGNITLGSGTDVIIVNTSQAGPVTAAGWSIASGLESITGLEKTAAASVGADVDAADAAIAVADKLVFAGGQVAADGAVVGGGGSVLNGKLTFSGAGPATLQDAYAIADDAAVAPGDMVVFEYIGNTYVYGPAVPGDDVVVKLVGVTGVTHLVEDGATDQFFIV